MASVKDGKPDKKDTSGGIIIQPLAPACGTIDKTYWLFDYYSPSDGRIIGIAPDTLRYYDMTRLTDLKSKWGFNYILTIENRVSLANQAGFSNTNIMLLIDPRYNTLCVNTIRNNPVFWGYYSDETIKKIINADPWANIRGYFIPVKAEVDAKSPYSIYVDGETDPDYSDWVDDIVDEVTCTRYDIFIPFKDPDQRSLWTDFKNDFSDKFNMTWIAAHLDGNEYDNLIGHANNLGLHGLWYYQQDDATDYNSDDNISGFSMSMWKKGWMRRFERQWIYTYECTKPNPCDCNPQDLSDGWTLVNQLKTNFTREISY